MPFRPVPFEHSAGSDFLDPLAVPPLLLRRRDNVLVLALLLGAHAPHVLPLCHVLPLSSPQLLGLNGGQIGRPADLRMAYKTARPAETAQPFGGGSVNIELPELTAGTT